jgi:hypothetical protein
MATASILELRRIRTAGIDDPERAIALGRSVLLKGGHASAGDECISTERRAADVRLEYPGSTSCCGTGNRRR